MSSVFDADEEHGLSALLDTLVPPSEDGRMPGAGAIGLSAYIAEHAADLQPLIARGLAVFDSAAREQGEACFAALPAADRAQLLTAHGDQAPGLVPALVFHCYSGYYQDARVVRALGFEPRPPYPKGFPMEPTDAKRLEAMRQRAPLYRKV